MRVLICDDDKIVLTALKSILNADKEIEVCGVANDGLEAVESFDNLLPDVLLMDIRMKNMTGIEAGTKILEKHKDAKIIFLTTFDTDEYILSALKMGAKGYILKQNYESIAVALKMVMLGGRVFGDEIIDKVPLKTEVSKDVIVNFDLTEREMEVIELVSKGLSNKEIASTLFLSEGTVRNYISTILDKLYLRDRTQLVIFYYKNLAR